MVGGLADDVGIACVVPAARIIDILLELVAGVGDPGRLDFPDRMFVEKGGNESDAWPLSSGARISLSPWSFRQIRPARCRDPCQHAAIELLFAPVLHAVVMQMEVRCLIGGTYRLFDARGRIELEVGGNGTN